jgi:hypothetical protein
MGLSNSNYGSFGWRLGGSVVWVVMVLVWVTLVMTVEAKTKKECKGVWDEESWDGRCYDLTHPNAVNFNSKKHHDNQVEFCKDYIQTAPSTEGFCLCTQADYQYTLKTLDDKVSFL